MTTLTETGSNLRIDVPNLLSRSSLQSLQQLILQYNEEKRVVEVAATAAAAANAAEAAATVAAVVAPPPPTPQPASPHSVNHLLESCREALHLSKDHVASKLLRIIADRTGRIPSHLLVIDFYSPNRHVVNTVTYTWGKTAVHKQVHVTWPQLLDRYDRINNELSNTHFRCCNAHREFSWYEFPLTSIAEQTQTQRSALTSVFYAMNRCAVAAKNMDHDLRMFIARMMIEHDIQIVFDFCDLPK